MSYKNQPSAQPNEGVREQLKSNISASLNALRETMDEQHRIRFLEAIRNEKMSQEALQAISGLLENIQDAYDRDPNTNLHILDALIAAGSDGEITPEEIQKLSGGLIANTPENMGKIGGMIEKMTTMANQLGEQLGTLGAETLKHIAGFFGSNSLFGKICEYLKDQPKARIVLIEKSFNLPENTNPEEMKTLMNTINNNANAINRKYNPAPPYDFVDHVKEIKENMISEASITIDDISNTSNALKAEYLVGTKTLPSGTPSPAPAIAATATERVKKEVTTTLTTKIAENDTELMIVKKIDGGAEIEINRKKAEIKKIGDSAITSVAVLEARPTDPAAVILTLADKTIQIDATELKTCAMDTNKKEVKAKNLTTNSDLTFEIVFTA